MEASAKNIFKVIDNHHWMLVTFLLLNAASLETLGGEEARQNQVHQEYRTFKVGPTRLLKNGQMV